MRQPVRRWEQMHPAWQCTPGCFEYFRFVPMWVAKQTQQAVYSAVYVTGGHRMHAGLRYVIVTTQYSCRSFFLALEVIVFLRLMNFAPW